MSDDKQARKPDHIAYQVSEGKDGKSYFNNIGVSFEHKDGEGYSLQLHAVPIDGKVVVRKPSARQERDGGEHER